jgi:hypothetical protein
VAHNATVVERSHGILRVPISRKVRTPIPTELVTKEKYRIASFTNIAIRTQPITNADGKLKIHILIFYIPNLTAQLYIIRHMRDLRYLGLYRSAGQHHVATLIGDQTFSLIVGT